MLEIGDKATQASRRLNEGTFPDRYAKLVEELKGELAGVREQAIKARDACQGGGGGGDDRNACAFATGGVIGTVTRVRRVVERIEPLLRP